MPYAIRGAAPLANLPAPRRLTAPGAAPLLSCGGKHVSICKLETLVIEFYIFIYLQYIFIYLLLIYLFLVYFNTYYLFIVLFIYLFTFDSHYPKHFDVTKFWQSPRCILKMWKGPKDSESTSSWPGMPRPFKTMLNNAKHYQTMYAWDTQKQKSQEMLVRSWNKQISSFKTTCHKIMQSQSTSYIPACKHVHGVLCRYPCCKDTCILCAQVLDRHKGKPWSLACYSQDQYSMPGCDGSFSHCTSHSSSKPQTCHFKKRG